MRRRTRSSNDSGSIRVDHGWSTGNQLFGRYTINDERTLLAGAFPERPTSEALRAQQAAIGYTRTGASWVSESPLLVHAAARLRPSAERLRRQRGGRPGSAGSAKRSVHLRSAVHRGNQLRHGAGLQHPAAAAAGQHLVCLDEPVADAGPAYLEGRAPVLALHDGVPAEPVRSRANICTAGDLLPIRRTPRRAAIRSPTFCSATRQRPSATSGRRRRICGRTPMRRTCRTTGG